MKPTMVSKLAMLLESCAERMEIQISTMTSRTSVWYYPVSKMQNSRHSCLASNEFIDG